MRRRNEGLTNGPEQAPRRTSSLGRGAPLLATALLALPTTGIGQDAETVAVGPGRSLAVPEAHQAVAVDRDHVYAIANRSIAKIDRRTGSRTAAWEGHEDGPLVHLNSGVVLDGRLYAAHSNFPGVPHASSIEVWDAASMEHVESQPLGTGRGSATWIGRHAGAWWVGFAHYEGRGGLPGKGPEWTRLVRYDEAWRPTGAWLFPAEVVERLRPNSASGGAWGPDGRLYVTGHDAAEVYALELPAAGAVLELDEILPFAGHGQGIAWDPADPGVLFGIRRSTHEIVASRLLKGTEFRSGRTDSLPRERLLELWAHAFFPGRSGDVMFVPRRGEMVTDPGPNDRFMHGSPWDYDATIPMILAGDPWIRPGTFPGPVSHEDLGATLAELLRVPPPAGADGRALVDALDLQQRSAPRLVALLVLDGMRADDIERHGDSLPHLRALAATGAAFPDARIDYLPTATAVAHATLSTGSTPSLHGIVANDLVPAGERGAIGAFEDASPRELVATTLADRWSTLTGGRAVVAVQGGVDYAAAALAGHGACITGGIRPYVSFYRRDTGTWGTQEACYKLPPDHAALDATTLWPEGWPDWRGHEVADPSGLRRTGLFAHLEGEAAVRTLRSLPFGQDETPDLFLANLKTLDYIGHRYGPDSPEIASALADVDRTVSRIVDALDREAGEGGWVLAVTSDHGMAPEPPTGRSRHYVEEIVANLDGRFDPSGPGVVRFLDDSALQIYLDRDRLAELGTTVDDVARYMEGLPWVEATFTLGEVAAAVQERGAR